MLLPPHVISQLRYAVKPETTCAKLSPNHTVASTQLQFDGFSLSLHPRY